LEFMALPRSACRVSFSGGDVLLAAGLGDQLFGQDGRLPLDHQPPHHVAAVDIEDVDRDNK